ncbi:class II aldolase and Adducin domain-containing protein [Aaosphaeria arxii CBS 175.79]|uniref:Class II aldolase and Adducin domain-containing protein n=1 Tax=Aaosphaeria arxii CBS 175.79 TaxID=1450172 RepID=A0A6A5X7H8_9PLEO|nr:class II aldolase and Adducin domain-containing protein [Aaosphaeria arxii CBS 175.79]KAF2008883.1 class II aldolase and Adducin domain-containing protein [Aaosphaeria arxii CBS 175.79]
MSVTTTATTTAAAPSTVLSTTQVSQPSSEPKRCHYIPWPETIKERQKWQLEQMAGAFRVFAKLGYADGGSGHISLRDPVQPDTFWINPYGVHFGLLKVSDMVQVDAQGNRIGGANAAVNKAGFIIHSAIHEARPDINAACHLHSPYGRAWSTFGRPIDMLNQDSCMFYSDLSVYTSFGGVVFAPEEGKKIAAAMGSRNKNVILQNHGILTCGGTVAEAAAFFIALERACQTQLLIESCVAPGTEGALAGLTKTFVSDEEAAYTKAGTGTPEVMYMQFDPEYKMVLKESQGDFLQ